MIHKVLLLFVVVFSLCRSYGQAGEKRNIHFDLSTGLEIFELTFNQDFKKGTGASIDYRFDVAYNTHDRVAVKFGLGSKKYLSDNTSRDKIISSNQIGLGLLFYMINRPKFSLKLGIDLGVFNFEYRTEQVVPKTDTVNVALFTANGVYNKMQLTATKYFGKLKHFGVFLDLGIANNPMKLDNVFYNDKEITSFNNTDIEDIRINSIGGYGHIGLTYYF